MEVCSSVRQKGLNNYTKHELYCTWRMMNYRCYSDVHTNFSSYGGRGVYVCAEWRWDNPLGMFNFVKDMMPRPSGTTLDRTKPDGIYSKDNCRWADKKTQQNNFRPDTDSETGYMGVLRDRKGRFVAQITLNEVMVAINHYPTIEEAIAARKQALRWKVDLGDDKALENIQENIVTLSNGKRPYARKTSKYYGVSWDKFRCVWKAVVPVRQACGKLHQTYLGRHATEEAAHRAVLAFLERENNAGSI